MFSILRRTPENPADAPSYTVRSKEGWWVTLLDPSKAHRAARFTDRREAEEVAKALSGRRRNFSAYEVVEVHPADPRFMGPAR